MKTVLVALSCLIACTGKAPDASGTRGPGSGGSGSPVVAAPMVADAAVTPPPPPDEVLPLSADVLHHDEATPDTRVVSGDGFHYQIPKDFTKAGANAYSGTVTGFTSTAKLTFAATAEPFRGSLDDLVAREAKGADDVGPVMVQVAGDVKEQYAKRFTVKTDSDIELRTVLVHEGKAYILRCSTPNVPNAWANVGSDCITRSTTFHVAPPPLVKIAAPVGGAPPTTEGVIIMASKIKGEARPKADVNDWLETAAQWLKPCALPASAGTTFKITFDLGADGRASNPSAEVGTDAFKPVDATTKSCIETAVGKLAIGTPAKAAETLTVLLVRQ